MNEEISLMIKEFMEDYEKYGKNKEPEVWLKEALIRKVEGLSEERAEEIKNELMRGIKIYRQNKNIGLMGYLKQKGAEYVSKYKELVSKIEEVFENMFSEKDN